MTKKGRNNTETYTFKGGAEMMSESRNSTKQQIFLALENVLWLSYFREIG